jgi:molybdenum cofactor biosynthesis protein MoaC
MVDITSKVSSLRKALAGAILSVSRPETIAAVEGRKVPKGDVFEFSRAAGLLAIKKTSDVIPDCHPLPVEFAAITYRIEGLDIHILVEVHTIYRTGVEVEAMHGAAITALTMYDMLKPLDKGLRISEIRLMEKSGGKSGFAVTSSGSAGTAADSGGSAGSAAAGSAAAGSAAPAPAARCAVVVCSDTRTPETDGAGKAIVDILSAHGLSSDYSIIPDEIDTIRSKARQLVADDYDLILFTGGTGLGPRDVTPEAIATLIDRPIPGIMEAARAYGQERTPYAMLSRGVAGFIGNALVLTLPGSTRGAEESMHALFPYILHAFNPSTH